MSERVSTRLKKIEFVKGFLAGDADPGDGSVECGDGKAFAMEITGSSQKEKLDKLAEIYFRVQDSWFTDGTISGGGSGEISLTGFDPASKQVEGGSTLSSARWLRGRYTADDVASESYATSFGTSYEIMYAGTSTGNFVSEAVKEYAMFTDAEFGEQEFPPAFFGLGDYSFPTNGFGCGFTHYSYAEELTIPDQPTEYGFVETSQSEYPSESGEFVDSFNAIEVLVQLSGRVATIDGKHPAGSGTRIFIEIAFEIWLPGFGLSASIREADSVEPSTADFVLELSDSKSVKCPMYPAIFGDTHTDFKLTAKKWFPYQDGNGDVWDSSTGERN